MVFIPYEYFKEHIKKTKKDITSEEIKVRWYKLLEFYPTKKSEWEMLINMYGDLLKYHFTNWTQFGRVLRPTGLRCWKELVLGDDYENYFSNNSL